MRELLGGTEKGSVSPTLLLICPQIYDLFRPPCLIMNWYVVCCSRCLAVLHCYYRFKKIHRLGSAFIMKIAASYLAFTLVLFLLIATSLGPPSSMKVRLLYDSWFMVLLLMDMQVKVRQDTTVEVQISKIRASVWTSNEFRETASISTTFFPHFSSCYAT